FVAHEERDVHFSLVILNYQARDPQGRFNYIGVGWHLHASHIELEWNVNPDVLGTSETTCAQQSRQDELQQHPCHSLPLSNLFRIFCTRTQRDATPLNICNFCWSTSGFIELLYPKRELDDRNKP